MLSKRRVPVNIESIESLFLHNLDAGSLGSSANIDNVIVAIFCLVVRIASVDVDEAIASESSLLDDDDDADEAAAAPDCLVRECI